MYKNIVLIAFFFIPIISFGQQNWELKKNEDGIRVYSRAAEGSRLKAIKVICNLPGSLSQLTALLLDAKAHEDWVYNTKSSYVVKQVSPNNQIYYSEIKLPWPLANRDVVVQMTLNQDPVTKVLLVKVDAIDSDIQKKDGVVRVPHSSVTWKVTPISAVKMSVEYVAQADPGGSVPVWLVNSFSTKGPLETFKRLRALISSNAYASADYAFIKD